MILKIFWAVLLALNAACLYLAVVWHGNFFVLAYTGAMTIWCTRGLLREFGPAKL